MHGGGPEINKEAQKAHIIPKFVRGLRYTDKKTMQIVKKVCKGINKEISDMLKKEKCKAKDVRLGLIKTKIKDKELGLVGEILQINGKKILTAIKKGFIPVVSPIGFDGINHNNINADTVATKIAEAVKAGTNRGEHLSRTEPGSGIRNDFRGPGAGSSVVSRLSDGPRKQTGPQPPFLLPSAWRSRKTHCL